MKWLNRLLFDYEIAYRNSLELYANDLLTDEQNYKDSLQYAILKSGVGVRHKLSYLEVDSCANRFLRELCRPGKPIDVGFVLDYFSSLRWDSDFGTIRMFGIKSKNIPKNIVSNYRRFLTKPVFNVESVLNSYFERRYSYIFVRQDMSKEQQLVQAAHVTTLLGNALTPHDVEGLYFTVIGVRDGEELTQAYQHLVSRDIEFVKFIEPDVAYETTAVASFPVKAWARGNLLKYRALRLNNESR